MTIASGIALKATSNKNPDDAAMRALASCTALVHAIAEGRAQYADDNRIGAAHRPLRPISQSGGTGLANRDGFDIEVEEVCRSNSDESSG